MAPGSALKSRILNLTRGRPLGILRRGDSKPRLRCLLETAGTSLLDWLLPIDDVPTLANPTSQLCTASQFRERDYLRLCAEIAQKPLFHRKQWEYVYILRVLEHFDMLRAGRSGLGFGCGKEPLAAVMAKRGCDLVCTDIAPAQGSDEYWGSTNVKDYFYEGICDLAQFEKRVRFRPVDMNEIPDDLGQHDFMWSSCALEHLGSLDHGIRFVLEANKCLKPGGIGVHTTEYNVQGGRTLETEGLSLYRSADIERLRKQVIAQGNAFLPITFHTGDDPIDKHVDLPPYGRERHLKLMVAEKYVTTSIGFVVQRAQR